MLESEGPMDPKQLWNLLADNNKLKKELPEFWVGLEKEQGNNIYTEIIYLLTRRQFPPDRARKYWFEILEHRVELNGKLDRDLGLRVALFDYFVNVRPEVENPIIVEGNLLEQKEQSALRDDLTGLYNRRFFNGIMQKQVAAAQRFNRPFSLLILDVDNFKNYNDHLGHPAGDRALIQLAQVLSHTARAVDYIVRYGGEEFAVILPSTDQNQGLTAAERHRRAVEECPFPNQECQPGKNLTVSIGVASFPEHAKTPFDLVYRADQALYEAKHDSRNRVCCSGADRRRHPRVPFRTEAAFSLDKHQRERLSGETRDISLGGLSLLTNREVERGKNVWIFIQLPDSDKTLELEGVTVNILSEPHLGGAYKLGVSLSGKKGNKELKNLVEQKLNQVN